jgi:maltose operon protein
MKMKKSLVALCLSAGLLASAAVTFADVNFVPQNTSRAGHSGGGAAAAVWTPVDQSKTQTTQLSRAANAECSGYYRPGRRLQRTGQHR